MAAADYLLCSVCDGKVVYDASVDYDQQSVGEVSGICSSCYSDGYRLEIARDQW